MQRTNIYVAPEFLSVALPVLTNMARVDRIDFGTDGIADVTMILTAEPGRFTATLEPI